MRAYPIYGDEPYLGIDRGSFIHDGGVWRPFKYNVKINLFLGTAVVEYTVRKLSKMPVEPEDWEDFTDEHIQGSFTHTLPDGYGHTWINECVLEELISQDVMGVLESNSGPNDRDVRAIMTPKINDRLVVGIIRDYKILDITAPVILDTVEFWGSSNNMHTAALEFWDQGDLTHVIDNPDNANYQWLDNNLRFPPPPGATKPPVTE